jgi:hypothetical protein
MAASHSKLGFRDQLRHTGSTDQLYSVRRSQLTEGKGDGLRMIDVYTAGGLDASFCESRALDLYTLRFKGTNIGFMSKNNLAQGPVLPIPDSFQQIWPGGMLATCGLRNTGPACEDDDSVYPFHGSIGSIPAEQVSIKIDESQDTASVCGNVRESSLFGHHFLLKRSVNLDLQGSTISWHDKVINLSSEPEPVFLLYHFNFGYPFLGPELQLHFPPGEVLPRTAEAEKGLPEFDLIGSPQDGEPEQVFFHQMLPGKDTDKTVRLVRSDLRIAAELTWSSTQLPWLIQWKSMKSGDYALGLEPSTSKIRGRTAELREGYDQVIKPYESWDYHLKLALMSLD